MKLECLNKILHKKAPDFKKIYPCKGKWTTPETLYGFFVFHISLVNTALGSYLLNISKYSKLNSDYVFWKEHYFYIRQKPGNEKDFCEKLREKCLTNEISFWCYEEFFSCDKLLFVIHL